MAVDLEQMDESLTSLMAAFRTAHLARADLRVATEELPPRAFLCGCADALSAIVQAVAIALISVASDDISKEPTSIEEQASIIRQFLMTVVDQTVTPKLVVDLTEACKRATAPMRARQS